MAKPVLQSTQGQPTNEEDILELPRSYNQFELQFTPKAFFISTGCEDCQRHAIIIIFRWSSRFACLGILLRACDVASDSLPLGKIQH